MTPRQTVTTWSGLFGVVALFAVMAWVFALLLLLGSFLLNLPLWGRL